MKNEEGRGATILPKFHEGLTNSGRLNIPRLASREESGMVEKPVDVPNFRCRANGCASTSYHALYEHNGVAGPGSYSRITGYQCDGCSVQFGDPKKFNLNR